MAVSPVTGQRKSAPVQPGKLGAGNARGGIDALWNDYFADAGSRGGCPGHYSSVVDGDVEVARLPAGQRSGGRAHGRGNVLQLPGLRSQFGQFGGLEPENPVSGAGNVYVQLQLAPSS